MAAILMLSRIIKIIFVPNAGTCYCFLDDVNKLLLDWIGLDFTISNGILKFNFLAVVVSEISGGPKFTLRGAVPPRRP